jgi:hypothetical protein
MTTGACVGLDVSTLKGPKLHLEVSKPQRPVQHPWTCLDNMRLCCTRTFRHHKGLNCTCTCLYNRSLDCLWACLYTTGDLAAPGCVIDNRESLLLLDVSTPQGSELHLYLSGQQEPGLLMGVSIHHR